MTEEEPFEYLLKKNCNECLQSSSEPTLHQVWPITLQIIQKLENFCETSDVIGKALAKASLAAIERKVLKGFISKTHKIATVLNPSTRKLNGVSTIEKQSIYRKIREQLDDPSPQFSTRPLLSMEEEDEESDELSSYLNFKFGNVTSKDFDLLEFWNKHQLQFPQSYKIAMNVLCIPATSCFPERGFSVMKKLITDERSQLGANTVSSIMIGRTLEDADSIEN
uniref:HAT C-terminal dimerisation domain-containing protein n=1 Tax=Panagrolaimus sp. PS1159 TaxID=55785 RepID=A0AC35GMT7_9BILA